jgi:hypothetical protein
LALNHDDTRTFAAPWHRASHPVRHHALWRPIVVSPGPIVQGDPQNLRSPGPCVLADVRATQRD